MENARRRLAFSTPEKKPSYCTRRSIRRFQKPFFIDLASRGARFQSVDFPSPKSRTASALRSTGVLQSRTPYNLRSIAPRRQKKAQVPVASKRERFDRAHTSPHAAASTWKRAPHAPHHPHLSHARITAHERAPSETHERRRYARSAARSLLRVTPNQVVECQDERPRHRELVRRARHEEEEEEQGACRSCICTLERFPVRDARLADRAVSPTSRRGRFLPSSRARRETDRRPRPRDREPRPALTP